MTPTHNRTCIFLLFTVLTLPSAAQTIQTLNDQSERLLSLRKYTEAIATCEKTIELDNQSPLAHECLANALIRSVPLGRPLDLQTLNRAKKEIQTSLTLSPNSADAMASLAEVTYLLGFGPTAIPPFGNSTGSAEALQLLQKALALDPASYRANLVTAEFEAGVFGKMLLQSASNPTGSGKEKQLPPGVKENLRTKTGPLLEDAIIREAKLASIRPDAVQPMQDLGELYRFRSYIDAQEPDAKSDLDKANDCFAKAKERLNLLQRGLSSPTNSPQVAPEHLHPSI